MFTLFQAEGVGWKIEIIGTIPKLPAFISQAPQTTIETVGAVSLQVFDRSSEKSYPIVSGDVLEPIFFEGVAYDVHFERTDATAVLTLPPGATARRIRTHNEHYALNFGNNVGFASISVSGAGGDTSLRIEVFSRKADFRTDYIAMRDEVSGMLRNLAMAANSRTFGLAAPAKDDNPTLVEWFALVLKHFEELWKIASVIASNPHSSLVRAQNLVVTERARRVSRQTLERNLRRNHGGAVIPGLGAALPRKIHESMFASNFDTPENRYFKALIRLTYQNIRTLQKAESSGDEDASTFSESKYFETIRPNLKMMERKLESILRSSFLGQVADVEPIRPNSMVLLKHPQYSRFDKLCRLLNGGLSFAGDIVPIGVKETALLYEYWCFLKIVSLLRDRFDLVEQTVVSFKRLRMTVALQKGRQSAMRFVYKPTGAEMYLVYNRLFNKLPTLAQQPDNVIQFATAERFYIFDAKYRLEFDGDYAKLYGGPGPTTEDVNTMHRYRDAIAIPHPMKPGAWNVGSVIGAVVLFPFPDEEAYRTHRFFKSIDQVEIGGLPFLPGTSSLVAKKIEAILEKEFPN
ncbi:DUF2357 domain-containing protein [Herbaspirillum frisingense]|uniref:DUF2357 domain-containing protein n=1 Tax=Herbaspirillum frisingense TaxID=92645 RepID=UPI001F430683|nr:DUF2357 domain-containing protein [Herbaspirillum frisingense]UIN20802.1 restriction endonuclease-like protein [Herbaspirillum frisingense]